jgi:N-acetylglucosamine-6-sulfatase
MKFTCVHRAALALCVVLALALTLSEKASAATKKHPNVVFVLTDDQRWDTISLSGKSGELKTPNIDRLGKEGVYFKNAFCTTSLCSPSRASILSGVYAHTHGVVNNFTEYPADMMSFPRRLHDS